MKFKKTYVLFAVALLFGAYIYFVEIKKAGEEASTKEKSEKILVFDADKVRKIYLKNTYGEFLIEKDPQNTWHLTKPLNALADEATINSLFGAVGLEKFEEVVSEKPEDLKNYGLDPGRMVLRFDFADGSNKEIRLGNDAALSGRLYIMDPARRSLFASTSLKFQIDKSAKELRDKAILKKGREQLSRIEVKSKAGQYALIKKDKKWFLEGETEKALDDETLLAFFNALEGLRATDFPSEKSTQPGELKKFGLEQPLLTVALFENDKPYDVLTISEKKMGNAFVKNKLTSTVYQVFANSTDGLMKKSIDFQDKKSFLQFGREDLKSFRIKTSLVDYSFVRKDQGWELEKPDPAKEVNQLQVMQFLNQMSGLRASEIFNKKAEITKPQGEIVLKDSKGSTLLDLKWGDKTPSGKSIYTTTQKTDKLFAVDESLIKAIPAQTLVGDKKAQNK